jgi:hypothetical protein
MLFSGNVLSMASRMKCMPRSSWLTLILGWKLLSVPRRHNKSSWPRVEDPLLFNAPLWHNVIYVNAIRVRLSKLPAHSNRFRLHLLFGWIFLCISLWAYLNQEII